MTRRAIAMTAIGAGALFVVLGSLFPLYGVETVMRLGPDGLPSDGSSRLVALTGWEYIQEPLPPGERIGSGVFPVYGHGLVFAAVLAAIGALMQLRSALPAAIGRFVVLAGAGLVVGTVWAVVETLRTLFGVGDGDGVTYTTDEFVGTGTWLLVVAALALIIGAAMAHDWPAREPRATGVSVYQVDDDDTPPFGIPIPVSELDVPPAGPVAPPVAELPPVVGLPDPRPGSVPGTTPGATADPWRHPTGGNPSTVD